MQEDFPLSEPRVRQAMTFQNAAFSGSQAAREPRAASPGASAEELRRAYLDVLKLCLCDLGGKSTISVWKDKRGAVMSRELRGEELQIRALGVDWPLQGLTMVGLPRLDDLQACVESVVRDGIDGDLIEAGTWRGGASILMRATLDVLGAKDRRVWVADSFDGFPIPDDDRSGGRGLAPVGFLAVPLEEVRDNFARFGCEEGVEFVRGFFEDTMAGLSGQRWSLVRLDGDTYEATWTTLQSLYPGLSVGGYLVVDDYGALEECQRAVNDFRSHHGITEPLEQVDWTCARWRRTSDAQVEASVPQAAPARANGGRPHPRADSTPDIRIPNVEELALRREKRRLDRELADLRGRVAIAETEVERFRSSPLYGPKAWLRRKLR